MFSIPSALFFGKHLLCNSNSACFLLDIPLGYQTQHIQHASSYLLPLPIMPFVSPLLFWQHRFTQAWHHRRSWKRPSLLPKYNLQWQFSPTVFLIFSPIPFSLSPLQIPYLDLLPIFRKLLFLLFYTTNRPDKVS